MPRAKRIRKILLAQRGLSREGRFPAQLLWFAKEQGARIHAVNVAPAPRSAFGDTTHADQALLDGRAHALEHLAQKAREKGLKVTTRVRPGAAHVELVREAEDSKADIVAVLEPARSGLRGLSDTAMHLIRECPSPVWVIRSPLKRNGRRVMAAVDLGPRGDAANRPNRRILEVAASFARAEGASLHVFHAWSRRSTASLDETGAGPEVEALAYEMWNAQKRRLDSLAHRAVLTDIDVEPHMEKGLARALVPQACRQLKVDVLVMGAWASTDASGGRLGNTAEGILQALETSVVVVKPDGPVSSKRAK